MRRFLREYEVTTAARLGWDRLENGALIRAAEEAGFDIFLTCDQNIQYQQNLVDRRIAIVEISTAIWPEIRPYLADVLAAVQAATPGSYAQVTLPRPPLRRHPYPPSPVC